MSPPSISQLKRSTKHVDGQDGSSPAHEHDAASDTSSTPDPGSTGPATRSTSQQPSEISEATVLDELCDSGILDNASSDTLQDEHDSGCHESDASKDTEKVPSTIIPALLQEINAVSSSRSSSDGDLSDPGGDVVPQHSAMEKGNWKLQTDGDDIPCSCGPVGSPSLQFYLDSTYDRVDVNDWVVHNRPILQDYADRQTSLPLGRRLEVTIDEPPRFILGAIQLLVNRDKRGCADRSRQLGPQLIENFVDIDRWAKEYFRSQHGTQVVDSDVPALLTIVMNNFYEGQVQLVDRLVEFALANMHLCGRSNLSIEDFAFGFDFSMSQDLPFYVETRSRIREPLPIPAVEVPLTTTSESVKTASGHQVKPTAHVDLVSEQAQTNANGRRNKGKNTLQVTDERPVKFSVPRPKKNSAQPSARRTETPATSQEAATSAPKTISTVYTRHRPARPSKLGLPPILPRSLSASRSTSSQTDDSGDSKPGASSPEERPKVSGSSGSNLTVQPAPRLTIRLPPASTKSTSTKTDSLSAQTNASEATNRGCAGGAIRPVGSRPRGPPNGRGCNRGQERGSASLTQDAETPEPTADDNKIVPTACPVEAGDAKGSTAVNPTVVFALRKAVWTTSTIQPRGVDNNSDTRDNAPSTSQGQRSDKPLSPTDPSHPKRKKRKVDDYED